MRGVSNKQCLLPFFIYIYSRFYINDFFPVGARNSILRLDDVSSDEDSPKPVRKVIKPVAAFQVSHRQHKNKCFHEEI